MDCLKPQKMIILRPGFGKTSELEEEEGTKTQKAKLSSSGGQ